MNFSQSEINRVNFYHENSKPEMQRPRIHEKLESLTSEWKLKLEGTSNRRAFGDSFSYSVLDPCCSGTEGKKCN